MSVAAESDARNGVGAQSAQAPVLADLPGDAVSTLEAMRAEKKARAASEVRELVLAAHLADVYGHASEADSPTLYEDRGAAATVLPGAERVVAVASEGAPEVAEFVALELGAALGLRVDSARQLIRDALNLRHRLPGVWRRVLCGRVPVWQARRLAVITAPLGRHEAGLVDVQLARAAHGMAWKRLEALAEALVLDHQPPEVVEEQRQQALEKRGVWFGQSYAAMGDDYAIAHIEATLDAGDAVLLDAQVERLAGILSQGGRKGSWDSLRAQALGQLASPAKALQLLQASILDQLPADPDTFEELCRRDGQAGHTCGAITVDPDELLPKAQMVVHLSDQTIFDKSGLVRIKGLRPVMAEWLADLLGHHRITVRPVIDQNHQVPSDAYECPPTMREAVEQRNPCEVFPWSIRDSHGLDLDHTIPYKPPGTGGRTHPDNLGPLTRTVHRAKTHAGWRLEQPLPGHFLWQSPLGFRYLVTPSRTLDLGRADQPQHARGAPSQRVVAAA